MSKKKRRKHATAIPCPSCMGESKEAENIGKLELVHELAIEKVNAVFWDGSQIFFKTEVECANHKKLILKCTNCSHIQVLKSAEDVKAQLDPWIDFLIENRYLVKTNFYNFNKNVTPHRNVSKKFLVLRNREEENEVQKVS